MIVRPASSGSQFDSVNRIESELGDVMESSTLDEILFTEAGFKILKIDVDGLDFDILQGAKTSLASGAICSVLIEATQESQSQISDFLTEFTFVPDKRFNEIESHSDLRRIKAGKSERNRVYTRLESISK